MFLSSSKTKASLNKYVWKRCKQNHLSSHHLTRLWWPFLVTCVGSALDFLAYPSSIPLSLSSKLQQNTRFPRRNLRAAFRHQGTARWPRISICRKLLIKWYILFFNLLLGSWMQRKPCGSANPLTLGFVRRVYNVTPAWKSKGRVKYPVFTISCLVLLWKRMTQEWFFFFHISSEYPKFPCS